MNESLDGEELAQQEPLPAPPEFSKDLFLEWRSPRLGSMNPQDLTNPVWKWLVHSKWSAYQVNDHFKGVDPFESGPGWCFRRWGTSRTLLPDGRKIYIAGEHEDHYDPDFFIYNDVVVESPDGDIRIFGYPHEIFQPTDFHSATLVENTVVVIGNLSYPDLRVPGMTPVYILELSNLSMHKLPTGGEMPGWIHKHTATLKGNKIIISGGMVQSSDSNLPFKINFDDWELDLTSKEWARLTSRPWEHWILRRGDGEMLSLFEIRQAAFWQKYGNTFKKGEFVSAIPEKTFSQEKFNLTEILYSPRYQHTILDKDPLGTPLKILVDGIPLSFKEETHGISILTEGSSENPSLQEVMEELRVKLSLIEETEITMIRLSP